jgi:hypothetical protein
MRKLNLLLILLAVCFLMVEAQAQDKKPLSPKETVKGNVGGVETEIVYCRPSARNRKMIGGKEPYGSVWRTGANAATTIEFNKAVKIEGKSLPAGKYALFTIPNENEWTIIINKDYNQQGAYNYDQKKDVLRVNVKPKKTDRFIETFTISPEKDRVSLKWENTEVGFKVKS